MKKILNHLFAHNRLTKDQAHGLLLKISEGKYNPSQVAVFMGVFMMRSISVEELSGFRDALLDLCVPFHLDGLSSTDLCGTGGDGKNTFNISTTTSFVVAGAGYKVTKHGNYGVSSLCGSSNVLEHLGYNFTNDTGILKKQLDKTNICFIHAPLFHPAMKFVAPIRKELGVKTFFNMLGPLVNPVQPTHQTVGVFSLELATLYQYLLEEKHRTYSILFALDGYDEVSLTDKTLVLNNDGEKIADAKYFNTGKIEPKKIYGGKTIKESSDILLSILDNKGTNAQRNVVLANASIAIKNMSPELTLSDCKQLAIESIESGKARDTLNSVIELSK